VASLRKQISSFEIFFAKIEIYLINRAIPGEIKGYYDAYKIGGRLPWKDLFQPAIDLCMNGFKISKALEKALISTETYIRNNSVLYDIFVNKITNQLLNSNDIAKMPLLGNTLRIISESNTSDVFYNSNLTKRIVEEINENGK